MKRIDENQQVLNIVQAMLGSITENFRAVFLNCHDTGVVITFILQRDNVEDREEIDDILFEFEALQLSGIHVDFKVIVDSKHLAEIEISGRMVFGRKEN